MGQTGHQNKETPFKTGSNVKAVSLTTENQSNHNCSPQTYYKYKNVLQVKQQCNKMSIFSIIINKYKQLLLIILK
jgi:hypothetical protein